jgi:hypothetical protein
MAIPKSPVRLRGEHGRGRFNSVLEVDGILTVSNTVRALATFEGNPATVTPDLVGPTVTLTGSV